MGSEPLILSDDERMMLQDAIAAELARLIVRLPGNANPSVRERFDAYTNLGRKIGMDL